MNRDHLSKHVIKPALKVLGLWSHDAERLVLETACAESSLLYLTQNGGGPARGLWQIEPATARDILRRYLSRRKDLRHKLISACYPLGKMSWSGEWSTEEIEHALIINLALGACVCRLKYLPIPAPIPYTVKGRAEYWLKYYNTGGAGTLKHYVEASDVLPDS